MVLMHLIKYLESQARVGRVLWESALVVYVSVKENVCERSGERERKREGDSGK